MVPDSFIFDSRPPTATMSRRSGRDPDPMERFLQAEWPEVRKRGRDHFIWRQRVLPIGLPTAVIVATWAFSEVGFSWRDLLKPHGLGLAYIGMVLGAGIFYLFARVEWDERERRYREKHGDDTYGGTE